MIASVLFPLDTKSGFEQWRTTSGAAACYSEQGRVKFGCQVEDMNLELYVPGPSFGRAFPSWPFFTARRWFGATAASFDRSRSTLQL